MPAQQGVGRRDGGELSQRCTAHPVCSSQPPSAIVVSQAQPPGPKLAPQKPVFFDQYATASRSRRFSQPVSTPSNSCSAAGSITSRSLYHGQA
jgi:hypothetical protein